MTPLAQDRPSQATLSRLLTCLGRNDNIDTVHEGLLRLVLWRLTSLKNGERPKQLTLDIDGLPIEVHGHQGGSAYHGLYGTRIYSPLIASLAETGDMVGGLLREGNAGPAENADTWIPHLVRRLNESTGARFVCASTPDSPTTTRWKPWRIGGSNTWAGCAVTPVYRSWQHRS